MFTIEDNVIRLIRGDTLRALVEIRCDGEPYVLSEGDVVRFAMKRSVDELNPLILKIIPHDTLTLTIDPEDTKPLPFGKYVYDVELTMEDGTVDTFIPLTAFFIEKEVH